jgi:5-methylcytosine-specific restriction endonuclease McrA
VTLIGSRRGRRWDVPGTRTSSSSTRWRTRPSGPLSDLCRRLRIFPGGGNYESLRDHARRLGLDPDERFPRQRVGEVRAIERSVLQHALDTHPNRTEALRSLGIRPTASAYRSLDRLAAAGEIDLSRYHGQDWRSGRTFPERRRRSVERKLVQGRRTSTHELKTQLLALGIKEHRCEGCGRARWNSHLIPLELDHIDGDRTDNRLENLRLLCPNCHAQTPTYRGRNIGRSR